MTRAELIARLQEGASLGAARLKKAAAHPALKRALSVLLRTPPLALDFARPQSRSHGTGLAAVALGAVLLTLALWRMRSRMPFAILPGRMHAAFIRL